MTFSYSDPTSSDADAVRYLIGDTVEDGSLVSDEEIEYALERWMPVNGTVEWVASTVLDTLAGKYAREVSYSADGVSVSMAGLRDQFAAQAAQLRAQHKDLFVGAIVDVGGIDAYEQQDDSVKPFAFGTGMHDNTSAGIQEPGSGPSTKHYDPLVEE